MFWNAFHLELNKIKLDCMVPAPSAFKELILTFRDVARAWIVLCPGGGGDSAYERGEDARRKFWIKPLKVTDLGVAQAIFNPQKRPC